MIVITNSDELKAFLAARRKRKLSWRAQQVLDNMERMRKREIDERVTRRENVKDALAVLADVSSSTNPNQEVNEHR
jgi:hypothetical protein